MRRRVLLPSTFLLIACLSACGASRLVRPEPRLPSEEGDAEKVAPTTTTAENPAPQETAPTTKDDDADLGPRRPLDVDHPNGLVLRYDLAAGWEDPVRTSNYSAAPIHKGADGKPDAGVRMISMPRSGISVSEVVEQMRSGTPGMIVSEVDPEDRETTADDASGRRFHWRLPPPTFDWQTPGPVNPGVEGVTIVRVMPEDPLSLLLCQGAWHPPSCPTITSDVEAMCASARMVQPPEDEAP